jgi:branched-chain amino acid transport system permease protein
VISGVAQGCIYGLIALGFVLIYKATETVSFAQGELMMLGAFCGLAMMTMLGFPFWLAVLGGHGGMALIGVGWSALVIRPILGQPAFSIVMLTIGIGYVAARPDHDDPRHRHRDPHPAGALQGQVWNLGGWS